MLAIERYSHVMHLVSNVKGTLKSDRTLIDLIRALLFGGTITGCPKVRCMEIIEELEAVRRNLFYGSCGYARLAQKPRLKYLDPHPLTNSLISTAVAPRRSDTLEKRLSMREKTPLPPHLPHPSTPSGDKFARELSPITILRENGTNLCTKLRHNFRL